MIGCSLRSFARVAFSVLMVSTVLLSARSADAYSVLSHEEVVDMAWKEQLVPMLKSRFPGITEDDIREAHAYAYGGSVIQDIGYYPFGSHYFSDMLHYVRPNEFVAALIRDSTTPDEYAFALGALAHFCGDTVGHPYVNQLTAAENPKLQHRFGSTVTYAEDPTAHLRTEFGFDVVEVAYGHYSQENYRDFIGFQVSKPLLERAFQETYGLPMSDLIKHEDLAIATYRKAVSALIPQMTRVAFVNYKNEIEQAAPGITKDKFMYRLNQTEYNKSFGTDFTRVGVRGHILAFLIKVTPKVGPLKALKLPIPNAQEQVLYLKSINAVVDQFKVYLAQIQAAPAPLPLPNAKGAQDAMKAAEKVGKDAEKFDKLAQQAKDTDDKARKEKIAANVQKMAEKATAAAERKQAAVDKIGATGDVEAAKPTSSLASDSPITAPTTPMLPDLDMDTGKPAHSGEYRLADRTYAKLLGDLIDNSPKVPAGAAPTQTVDVALASDIRHFFHAPQINAEASLTPKDAAADAAMQTKVQADLLKLTAIAQPVAKKVAHAQQQVK